MLKLQYKYFAIYTIQTTTKKNRKKKKNGKKSF